MPHITLNNKSLYYVVNEPEQQPNATLLLIHGLGSSSSFYYPVIPFLVKAGIRCIALDTYGSGLSHFTGTHQDVETIAKDSVALLDTLKVQEPVTVVGHSMGGIVASHLAATCPERVQNVVLIGPVNPSENVAKVFEERIANVERGM